MVLEQSKKDDKSMKNDKSPAIRFNLKIPYLSSASVEADFCSNPALFCLTIFLVADHLNDTALHRRNANLNISIYI